MHGCAFLPLTTDTAARLCGRPDSPELDRAATVIRHRADAAEAAAERCWTALLAGCDAPVRWELGACLRKLSEATALYTGTRWWFAEGSVHRRRVAGAQARIEAAVVEGDGGEFAAAFVGYDHAMASAVVCAQTRHGGHQDGRRSAPRRVAGA